MAGHRRFPVGIGDMMSEPRTPPESRDAPLPGSAPPPLGPAGAAQASPPPHELQRLCRHCSTQTVTDSATCPVCGASYVHESWFTKQRVIALTAAAAVIVLIGGGVMVVRARQAQQAEEQRIAAQTAAEAEQARADEAAAAARAKKAQEVADAEQAQRQVRELQVPGIEQSVTKMARGHASDGLIDGWPKSTTCSPTAGQSIDNLNKTTTKFSCFVITQRLSGGQSRGHYYQALMNWDTGRYTYGYDR